MKELRLLLLACLILIFPGCTTTEYSDAQVKFKRVSFFNTAKIGKLEKTKDGIVLEGYVNDQISGAALVAGAVAEGMAKGAKP